MDLSGFSDGMCALRGVDDHLPIVLPSGLLSSCFWFPQHPPSRLLSSCLSVDAEVFGFEVALVVALCLPEYIINQVIA